MDQPVQTNARTKAEYRQRENAQVATTLIRFRPSIPMENTPPVFDRMEPIMRLPTKRFCAGTVAAAAVRGAGAGAAMESTAPSAAGRSKVSVSVKAGVVVDVEAQGAVTVKLG